MLSFGQILQWLTALSSGLIESLELRMSDPTVKGIKRSSSNPTSRHASSTSSTKGRALPGKTARPKPMVKRSPSGKAPARKATKTTVLSSAKNKVKKVVKAKPVASAKKSVKKKAATPRKASPKRTAVARNKPATRKPVTTKPAKKAVAKPTVVAKPAVATKPTKSKPVIAPAPRPPVKPIPVPVPRQPTRDEAAALRVFEKAHREFTRGRFAEAGSIFRSLLEKHPGASEVAARARTYLAIAESRLRREISLPRDADSLYDRGVIELNRGEYVAAQEMFERALKREPEAAHIHYGLAATRARLGAIDAALESLHKALDIQPSLRVRAQHDQDLTTLRNDPVFEQLIFAPRL